MKKVIILLLIAGSAVLSCKGSDPRVSEFESKEFGELVVQQEALLKDILDAMDKNDSGKVKELEEKMIASDAEVKEIMGGISVTDQEKALEIMEPLAMKYMNKLLQSEGLDVDGGAGIENLDAELQQLEEESRKEENRGE